MEGKEIIFVGEKIPIETKPVYLNEEKRKELSTIIDNSQNGLMNVEENVLTSLMIEFNQYPEINPSFLSMSNLINYNQQEIQVPRFGVFEANYHINEKDRTKKINGFSDFIVGFSAYRDDDNPFHMPKRLRVEFLSRCGNNRAYSLPRILADELAQATELPKTKNIEWNGEFNPYGFKHFPKELWKKYRAIGTDNWGRTTSLKTEFSGLIPNKIKETLERAEQIFPGTRSVYLIAEIEPRSWRETRLQVDPLLIGLHNNKVFLIDHFNTTPLEDYIRKDFLK